MADKMPAPHLAFTFYDRQEAETARQTIESEVEGLNDIRINEYREEYWPGKFRIVYELRLWLKGELPLSQLVELLNSYVST